MVPHKDSCHLDYDVGSQRWVLMTHESIKLDAGRWSLCLADEGYGEVVEESGRRIGIDDLVVTAVYRGKAGRLIFVDEEDDHLDGKGRRYLDTESSRFVLGTVRLRVGAGGDRAELKVASVLWHRSDCTVFWSFVGLYSAMSLDLFKNTPSRWACNGFLTGN